MTYQGPLSALDALVAASRVAPLAERPRAPSLFESIVRPAARTRPVHADPRASALLGRLYGGEATGRAILFLSCGDIGAASSVALACAQAACVVKGRTLLVSLHERGESAAATPDVFLPNLFHRNLVGSEEERALIFGDNRAARFAALTEPYAAALFYGARDTELPLLAALPCCRATVLVVEAGRSEAERVREAADFVRRAGGRLMGTVLAGAPALPDWVRARRS